ncbi:hypothetical protein B5M06_14665 [Comamonas kerstersii]|uniref:Chemotaxis protein n=1 Tax=Comamonas kerstersii TaxID=225992 RepID=A0A1V0BHB6_9BURK|nr:hypothetical protein [Comamonas kerstersii]AQZ99307.1 hypothetical protein B5M06_14665 [Comamonas kerstersii]
MAVPLILGAVAAGTALYGAYKGVSGAIDQSNASDINKEASAIVDKANREVDIQRQSTSDILEEYGKRKLRAFESVIEDFLMTFGRLKNVELVGSPELEKLKMDDFSNKTLAGLRGDYQALKDAGLGLGAGVSSGAALAFGAYNGTMMLATASTGTAISSLGGAAATNATLAWLGGGSLAAGGGGMALGTMVLGGIVAGPALAIFGHIMGNKGEEALNNARSNLEQAKTIQEEAKLVVTSLDAIEQVTILADTTFSRLNRELRRAVQSLDDVIDTYGEDFEAFTQDSREVVFKTVKYAQLIKAMIDTPILDTDGKLVLSTQKRVTEIAKAINA